MLLGEHKFVIAVYFCWTTPLLSCSISCKSFCLKVYFVLYINIGKSALVVFSVFAPMLVHQSALFLSVLQNLVKTSCLLVIHSHLILFIVILVFSPIYHFKDYMKWECNCCLHFKQKGLFTYFLTIYFYFHRYLNSWISWIHLIKKLSWNA